VKGLLRDHLVFGTYAQDWGSRSHNAFGRHWWKTSHW